MPINDFKPFAAGPGANVTSQADWENLPALLTGFMSGKASSAQMNKAFRQASFIAAALAQFVSEKTDQDVLDDGDLPGFVEKLTAGFAAQYLSRSNPFGDIASDGPEAIATALSNLGLGTAATKDVGTGENQIPDMSSFGSGSGWSQLPNGKLLQWGTYTGSAITGTINFPVPFPSSVGRVIMSLSGTSADAGSIAYVVQDDNSLSKTSFFFRRAGAQVRFNWFCIGE